MGNPASRQDTAIGQLREQHRHYGNHMINMNDYNATVAEGVLQSIRGFEAGTLTLEDVQAALESALPLFENDGSGVAEAVRLTEADLEGIQCTLLLDEQRPAAIHRLDGL